MRTGKGRVFTRRFLTAGIGFFAAAFSLWGCSISRPLVIARSVDLTGPMHQFPVRVTDRGIDGRLTLTPHVELFSSRTLTGRTNLNSDYDLADYANYDTANNVRWNLPSYEAGLSLDYGLSKTFSLSAGALYTNMSGREYYEWDGGLAACFQDANVGGRLEAGVQWQYIRYNVTLDRYNVTSNWSTGSTTTEYLYSFSRFGRYLTGNFYCNFTLNTKVKASPVNGFVRAGYGITSLLSDEMLKTRESGNISTSVGAVNLAAGFYFDIARWSRLVVGCSFISSTALSVSSPQWLVVPLAQMDFIL